MWSIFPLSQCQRNLILLFSLYKTLCKTPKIIHEFHLCCWNHVCNVNEWYLLDCFHCKFRVSTQIMQNIFHLQQAFNGPSCHSYYSNPVSCMGLITAINYCYSNHSPKAFVTQSFTPLCEYLWLAFLFSFFFSIHFSNFLTFLWYSKLCLENFLLHINYKSFCNLPTMSGIHNMSSWFWVILDYKLK